jgi:site-specific DNA recombinase
MVRKAKALHVTGGKVFGYRNEEVLDAEGRRLHVLRRIDPDEAAPVRRIFSLYAAGKDMISIAKTLNADGVKPPRGHGWAPSALREMLYRELYRGVIVWNRKQKITRGGTKKLRKRPESEWLRLEAPELQIVPPDLWEAVQPGCPRFGWHSLVAKTGASY